jgi:mRNA-degrading endonuclease RelE of RelBE toxin-antitoxin system
MKWGLAITSSAKRQLRRLSSPERYLINRAFDEMCEDPFSGDVKFLHGLDGALRRRIGDWRVLYELNHEHKVIIVTAVKRRGSNTY